MWAILLLWGLVYLCSFCAQFATFWHRSWVFEEEKTETKTSDTVVAKLSWCCCLRSCAVWELVFLLLLGLLGWLAACLQILPKLTFGFFLEDLHGQPLFCLCFGCLGLLGLLMWVLGLLFRSGFLYKPLDCLRKIASGLCCQQGYLLMLLVVLMLVCASFCASMAWLNDEHYYHLTFPVQYLRHGGHLLIEGHANSAFFSLLEMVALWPLAYGSLTAGRSVGLFVVFLGLRIVYDLTEPMYRCSFLCSALLYLLTPIVFIYLPSAYIDIPQGMLLLVSLFLWETFWCSFENFSLKYLYLSSFFMGCCAACKHTALGYVFMYALGILLMQRALVQKTQPPAWLVSSGSRQLRAALSTWQLFTVFFLLLGPVLPWLLRNFYFFGDPLFPFATSLFPGSEKHLLPSQWLVLDAFMARFGPESAGKPLDGLAALWRLPWSLVMEANFHGFVFDGILGPLLYVFFLLIAWHGLFHGARAMGIGNHAKETYYRGMGYPVVFNAYALFTLFLWLSSSWQMRFLSGIFWLVCLRIPYDSMRLPELWQRRLVFCLLLCCLAYNGSVLQKQLPSFRPWDWFLWRAQEQRQQRLAYRPASALCDKLNQQPPGKVLLVWTQALSVWCLQEIYSDSYDEAAHFQQWLQLPERKSTWHALQKQQIAYILIDHQLTALWQAMSKKEQQQMTKAQQRFYELLDSGMLQLLEQVEQTALYVVHSSKG